MKIDGLTLLEGSQIVNAVINHGTTFPVGPNNPPDIGELFYLTQTNGAFGPGLYYYDGTSTWQQIVDTASATTIAHDAAGAIVGVNYYTSLPSIASNPGLQNHQVAYLYDSVTAANTGLYLYDSGSDSWSFIAGPNKTAASSITGTITNSQINDVAWSKITSTPTTIAGYGITDVYTKTQVDSAISSNTPSFSTLTGKPTTVSGYGITDAITTSGGSVTGTLSIATGGHLTVADAPVNSSDAANKLYVDSAINGLSWKTSVKAATTVNITLSGTQSIDGVAILAGDRVLVKDQTNAAENGIYVAASGSWTRSTDMDSTTPINEINSAAVFVQQGVSQQDTGWTQVNAVTSLGTDSIAFTQFNGAGGTTAGIGLSKSGNQIDVNLGAGIAQLPTDEVGIDLYTGGGLITTVDGTTSSTVTGAQLSLSKVGTAGTYKSVTTDAYGRVTAGTNPTTLAGYGITDAQAYSVDIANIAASSADNTQLGYLQKRYVTLPLANKKLSINFDDGLTHQSYWNNGTIVNGSGVVTGEQYISSNKALKILRSSNYGAGYSGLSLGTQFTIEAWIYPVQGASAADGSDGYLFGWAGGGDSMLCLGPSGQLVLSNYSYTGSAGTVNLNAWNHIAFVVNGGNVKVYTNGIKSYDVNFNANYGAFSPTDVIINNSGFSRSASFYIDNLLATNNIRYTGNFVPNTQIDYYEWFLSTPTTLAGYGITDAQPLDADLTSIAGLSGTSGILKKTAANTWTLDTSTYATSTATFTLGSTSIALGSTTTSVAGLSSVTSTSFIGALTGNASTATSIAGGIANQIHYQTAVGTTGFITSANYGVLITNGSGAPSILAGSTGVLVGAAGSIPSWSTSPVLNGTNFTAIPNSALTNSALTIGTTPISLGGSVTTLGGLTSVTATNFIGNASTATALQTARAINGVSFNGTADITVADNTKLPLSGGTLTGALTLAADPTQALHAATKQYVDATASGLDFKQSVRVATTGNITLSGTQTIDGIAVVANDRVLVKDQTTTSQNGIYIVVSGGPWTRAADANTSALVTSGMFSFVEEGALNATTGWVLSTTGTITLGTTGLTFTQFSGAGSYTAGAGLTLSGSTFDVGTASTSRIVVNADNIDLATVSDSGTGSFVKLSKDTYGRVTGTTAVTSADITGIVTANTYQPYDADLASIAALSGTSGFLKTNGSGIWSVDTTSYLTGSNSLFIGTTSIALNRVSANQGLTGITSLAMPGTTSGTITLQPTAVAGTNTITLPAVTGTVVTTGDTGSVTNTMLAGSIAITKLASSAITINSVSTSLGGSITLYAGTTALGTTSGTVTLPNSSLTNSAITINGASTSLGGSVTVYAGTTALSTTSGATTLPNSALTNSSVTIGTTAISLGASSTTLAGLTSVTSTGFTGALTGNASTATTLQTSRNINGVAFNGSADITIADSTKLPLAGGTMTGSITIPTGQFISIADMPSSGAYAANKAYVDAKVGGLTWKASVKAATTANIAATYSNGTSGVGATLTNTPNTLDGYTLVANDRVLVKNQTTAFQNGIYTVTTLGTGSNGVWTRVTDMDATTPIDEINSTAVYVQNGTTFGSTSWTVTGTVVTIGTDAINWTQFTGTSASTAGAGLTMSGNVISLTSGVATAGTYKSVTVDTYGRVTAGTNPTTLAGYGITDAQSALGFTPVQQGGGTSQGNNKVYIGWGGSQLRLQVDTTDFGITWPIGITGNAATATAVAWSGITSKPTTLSGYGITDAQPLDADLTSWAAITRATGFDTFVATPSSANLAALVTDETGSGNLVFNTSPTFNNGITIAPNSGTNGFIEIGRTDGTATTPFIDFHSGATATDYDSRIIASGGNGSPDGGTLSLKAATVALPITTASTSTITGALTVAGGVGVAGTVNAGALVSNAIYTAHEVHSSVALTTSTTATNQVVDTYSTTTYRVAKYIVQVTSGTSYQASEILAIHDGTTVTFTENAQLNIGAALATFDMDISGGNVRLLVTPTNAVTTIKVIKDVIAI